MEQGGDRLQMQFDDNSLLPQLYGERDRHLDRIERELGVSLVSRGNRLAIAGRDLSGERLTTESRQNCQQLDGQR